MSKTFDEGIELSFRPGDTALFTLTCPDDGEEVVVRVSHDRQGSLHVVGETVGKELSAVGHALNSLKLSMRSRS